MKRITFILTFFFACLSAVHGQDRALLYEVSGNTLPQPSYLYGTFHLVCPADLQLSEATRKALADSRQLYLEIDFDEPSLQTKLIMGMMLGQGKNLSDYLNADDYAVLNKFLQDTTGRGLSLMGNLKPFALSAMVYVGMLKCEPASYDLTFAQLAGVQGKDVLGLETFEDQMAVLDSMSVEEQVKELVQIARNPDDARQELTSLMSAYRQQDLPQLMKLVDESKFGDSPEFTEELLNKRNQKWIPIIEKAAREKSTFIAFGAGHLGGEFGVVSLLRQKGYTVKPVR